MTIPVILVVALFVFLLLRLSPGDPAAVIAGDYATAEDVERIREKLGLSEPIVVQFASWVGALLQGDFAEGDVITVGLDKVADKLVFDRDTALATAS